MGSDAPRKASYADVAEAPDGLVAELAGGVLYTLPRPSLLHAQASAALGAELGGPFRRGKGGPGGWIFLDEPELHLGAEPDVLVPDLAGWRRSTLPELPDAAFLTVRPDWVCEVLSPRTRRLDRVVKMPIYLREGVPHVWLVDPEVKTLEVFGLDGSSYRLLATHAEDELVHAEPFEVFGLELGVLWQR